MNRSSGQITVKKGKGTELNFEGPKTTYTVEVTADDPFGLSRFYDGDHHRHRRERGAGADAHSGRRTRNPARNPMPWW